MSLQPDRETVYAALFTVVSTNTTVAALFQVLSRRIQPIESFPDANCPALFQTQKGEPFKTPKGVPSQRKFEAELVIYCYQGSDTTVITSTQLNACVTAIENALGPNAATQFQQLGVPVSSAVVNGKIEYFEGVLGAYCVAIVPVQVEANY